MNLARLTNTNHPKHHVAVTPDGRHVVFAEFKGARMTLMVTSIDGAASPRALMPDSGDYVQQHPAFSADGRRLAYTGSVGYRTGALGLYLCDVDTESMRCSNVRAVNTGFQAESPAWSLPTASGGGGKLIAFSAYRGAGANLYVIEIDALSGASPTVKPRQLTNVAGFAVQPTWSPDGKWLAFSCTKDGNYEIYKVRADGSELTRLTDHPSMDYRPQWSPTGESIAFTSNRDGNYEIYHMRPDGSEIANLTQHPALDDHVAWLPASSGFAFVSTRDAGFDVYRTLEG